MSAVDLPRVAAVVEQRSEDPLARAAVTCAQQAGVAVPPIDEFTSLIGAGAQARVDGTTYLVGSPALMAQRQLPLGALDDIIVSQQQEGRTAVVVADKPECSGCSASRTWSAPKPERRCMSSVLGVDQLVMLTGDNQRTAQTVGDQVGIYDIRPEDKSGAVATLVTEHRNVGMVGDGVDDAAALAAASVGIAMGTAGSDVALETADQDPSWPTTSPSSSRPSASAGAPARSCAKNSPSVLGILVLLVPGAVAS